jgi:hypothetical protein
MHLVTLHDLSDHDDSVVFDSNAPVVFAFLTDTFSEAFGLVMDHGEGYQATIEEIGE